MATLSQKEVAPASGDHADGTSRTSTSIMDDFVSYRHFLDMMIRNPSSTLFLGTVQGKISIVNEALYDSRATEYLETVVTDPVASEIGHLLHAMSHSSHGTSATAASSSSLAAPADTVCAYILAPSADIRMYCEHMSLFNPEHSDQLLPFLKKLWHDTSLSYMEEILAINNGILRGFMCPTGGDDHATSATEGKDGAARPIPSFSTPTNHENQTVEKLVHVAASAPFGDLAQGVTRVDPLVRQAWQITAPVLGGHFDRIHREIQARMFPGQPIELVYDKINIYGPGGHFARHTDTPKARVLGTVIVFGQSPFTGGDLVLYPAQASPAAADAMCGSIRGAAAAAADDDAAATTHATTTAGVRIRSGWCAFYSGIPHEVEPVLEGWRVTLVFHIKASENSIQKPYDKNLRRLVTVRMLPNPFPSNTSLLSSPGEPSAFNSSTSIANTVPTRLTERLKAIMRNTLHVSQIGVLLSHRYSMSEFREEPPACDGGVPRIIGFEPKGTDRQWVAAASQDPELELQFIPVLLRHVEHYGGTDEDGRGLLPDQVHFDDYNDINESVFRHFPSDIQDFCRRTGDASPKHPLPVGYEAKAGQSELKFFHVYPALPEDKTKKRSKRPRIDAKYQPYCDYIGNELQPEVIDNIYFTMAVLVRIRPARADSS